MKKTIYNVYVLMESQEQCDRMKQVCIDYGLPYWEFEDAFKFNEDGEYFCLCADNINFAIYGNYWNRKPITIPQFLELLNEKKELFIQCDFCSWKGKRVERKKNGHCPKCQSPTTKNK